MVVRLSGIDLARHPSRTIFQGFSLELGPEERLGLLGPNGCGKTSLLWTIVGLLRLQAGTVEVFGKIRQSESDFQDIRGPVGLLFQDADDQLFCVSVLDDVAFGPLHSGKSPPEARAIAIQTLERLGIGDYAERVTHHLSGGEKRLVALASVLAMQPKLLLLDEPDSELDETAKERVLALLLSLQLPMIVVSHDPSFLNRLCTRFENIPAENR